MRLSFKKNNWTANALALVLAAGFVLFHPRPLEAQEKKAVAVLPFAIHASQPLEAYKHSLQDMLTDRLAKFGIPVIPTKDVNRLPEASLPSPGQAELIALGRNLGANYVVTGSLTQIGKKISLDLRALDVTGEKPPFSLFMVEDDIDRINEAMDRASKSLYNQIAGIAQIDSVMVKGNQRVESDAILAVVESRKGESLDYDKLDKDLRAIYAMGYFKDVSVETENGAKGKIVIFKVVEKPSIGKITFVGNKKIKSEDLTKESGIKLYSIYNANEVKQSVNKLKDYYRQEGYYTVEITDKAEEMPRNEVALTYDIKEGEKVLIKKIEFVGNKKFSDGKLKDVMETSEKGFLSWFTSAGVLDKKKLETDAQKIAVFYQNHGYIRVTVGEPAVRYEPGQQGLIVTIEIKEGHQYLVNEVNVTGDLILPPEELLKKVQMVKPEPFSREIVRRDVLSLRDIYADDGYAYAEVSPLTREDDKNYTVDITYQITKRNKVRFERITINGNTVTRDNVIRRELEVYEGDYFSGSGMRKSTENLNRLGYFEDAEFQTKKGSTDELMDLTVNIKEKPTGAFTLGAGYSGSEGPTATASISQNNLFGTGRSLMAEVRISGISQFFDVRYSDPRLWDTQFSGGADVYKWEYQYDTYTRDSYGGDLRLGVPLPIDEYTRGGVIYGYDDTLIKDIAATAPFEIQEMAGWSVTSSMTFTVARDSKNRPWNTSSGSYNLLSFQYAGGILGGDVYFNRYEATTQWFIPFRWDTSFMVEGRWGYMQEREGRTIPSYQLYRIGGISTVRGYDQDSISPTAPNGDTIGGPKMMIYNFEFRFPLLKEQGVVGVVFFDMGNVFSQNENYSFTNIPRSAGAGFRWYSPFGPIRVEYGYILNRRPGDPVGNVEFQVGGNF